MAVNAPEARFRSEMGQISRHSAIFFLGTLFTAAAGYFFKIYVARVLGAGAVGVYALGMTLVGFFGLFNGLGLPQTAARFVAAYSATGQFDRLRQANHGGPEVSVSCRMKELRQQLVGALLVIITVAAVIAAAINLQQQNKFHLPDDGVTWLDQSQGANQNSAVVAVFVGRGSPGETIHGTSTAVRQGHG